MSESPQSFEKHTRWDPPFHFFLMPVAVITTIGIIVRAVRSPNLGNLWMVVVAVAGCVAILKIRINALRVQDRVIRLEERLRMAVILPEGMRSRIGELSDEQFIALRFASDGELAGLVRRALDEKLSGKDIKEAVTNWRPDYARV